MRYGKPEEAKRIVQELLDGIDDAYMTEDFDKQIQLVHVPHHIRTESEAFPIRTSEEMKVAFFSFLDHTKSLGGVTCKRTCHSAKFRGRDKIESIHDVEYFDVNGNHVLPVTQTTGITMHIGLSWRICASTNTTKITTGAGDAVRESLKQVKKM